jgi:glycosyltransferase involved in cell wall biosynthesis
MNQFGLGRQVMLLDNEPQPDLWRRYAGCNVLVSPAIHDGTPNSLLEGMAFGCLPVAGKIESIEEWITDGENGILVDPNDVDSVANGIIRGLSDRPLQERAAEFNWDLIQERVDRVKVKQQVDEFLSKVM